MDNLTKLRQKEIFINEQIYKCEICDKELKNKESLKMHVNIVHKFVNEHQCNICQKKFKMHSTLT